MALSLGDASQERGLSFTDGRPVESCSSLEQIYFGYKRSRYKPRASRIKDLLS